MLVVIGGHSRKIGKTSVICGVIRALPDWNWTAIKITQHRHGIRSREGVPAATDSGRFLASGAAQAFWIRTLPGELNKAMPAVFRILSRSEHAIIESNSIMEFLKPDLFAMMLDGSVADFKATSRRFLDRANAIVVTSAGSSEAWPEVPPDVLRNKPRFLAPPPSYESAEFVAYIAESI